MLRIEMANMMVWLLKMFMIMVSGGIKRKPSTTYAVFDPANIKSAITGD